VLLSTTSSADASVGKEVTNPTFFDVQLSKQRSTIRRQFETQSKSAAHETPREPDEH